MRLHQPSIDPWLLRQIHDELDAMKAAGGDVPAGAYDVADEMCHLVQDGLSARIVAEHALERAKRVAA